jgi:hypothetical protein
LADEAKTGHRDLIISFEFDTLLTKSKNMPILQDRNEMCEDDYSKVFCLINKSLIGIIY